MPVSIYFYTFFNVSRLPCQMNDITAYIDASQVYGSDKETAESLRDQEDRRFLDVTPVAKAAVRQCGLLPEAEKDAFCRSPNPKDKPCYRAGDERVNENQGNSELFKRLAWISILCSMQF